MTRLSLEVLRWYFEVRTHYIYCTSKYRACFFLRCMTLPVSPFLKVKTNLSRTTVVLTPKVVSSETLGLVDVPVVYKDGLLLQHRVLFEKKGLNNVISRVDIYTLYCRLFVAPVPCSRWYSTLRLENVF